MFRRVLGRFRHDVVAYLALFVALGGTSAWAAGQITGSQVKDESITGADVLNDSLGGADLDESKLGQVASAATSGNAVSASNADKLDTRDSTDFLGAGATAADSDKLDGTVDTTVVEGPGVNITLVGNTSKESTVTCPDDAIALRGAHTEEIQQGSITASARYARSSYTVTYTADEGDSHTATVKLKLRCLTASAP